MTSPEERAKAAVEAIERDGYRFLEDLSGHQESTLISYIASAIREEEEQVILRMRAPDLSSDELKMADKHCDWVSFKCAFRAVMKSRSKHKD
jgi:hypothetical protein